MKGPSYSLILQRKNVLVHRFIHHQFLWLFITLCLFYQYFLYNLDTKLLVYLQYMIALK